MGLRLTVAEVTAHNERVARGRLKFSATAPATLPPPPSRRRIRQNPKSKLNQTEARALAWLKDTFPSFAFKDHALRLELANGCQYTPDLIRLPETPWLCLYAYEVKGKHAWDDSIVKLKVAAREWPGIRFYLLWEEAGCWQSQEVLP